MAAAPVTYTELTDYIYPPLSALNYSDPSVKVAVVTTATMTSIFIYVTTHVYFSLTSRWYPTLRLKEKVFWNLAVVRAVFGIFCSIIGLWGIFANTALNEDVVLATSATSHLAAAVAVGFFVFECVAVTASDICFNTFSCLLQIHHWISLVGFIVVVVTDTAHCLACKGLMLEMSTPFSALCWTLLKVGQEHTLLWKVNQFLLVHTFHLRNVVEMMLWYITWQHWDNIWTNMPLPLFVSLYGQLTLITLFMTPYWTWKKTCQMISPVDWNFESVEVKKNGHVVVVAGREESRNRQNENGSVGHTRLNGNGNVGHTRLNGNGNVRHTRLNGNGNVGHTRLNGNVDHTRLNAVKEE